MAETQDTAEAMLEAVMQSITGAVLDDVSETLRAIRIRAFAGALRDLTEADENDLADIIAGEITDALEPPPDDEVADGHDTPSA